MMGLGMLHSSTRNQLKSNAANKNCTDFYYAYSTTAMQRERVQTTQNKTKKKD